MSPVTYVLTMFVTYVLTTDPPEKPNINRDAPDIDLWKVLLRHNTRRAVVYCGPRLGTFIGLIHRFA